MNIKLLEIASNELTRLFILLSSEKSDELTKAFARAEITKIYRGLFSLPIVAELPSIKTWKS